jgi:hypothetical protein
MPEQAPSDHHKSRKTCTANFIVKALELVEAVGVAGPHGSSITLNRNSVISAQPLNNHPQSARTKQSLLSKSLC